MDPAVTVYIAETNTPEYRATLLSLAGPIILSGTLAAYMLGHFLYWKHVALMLSFFSAACCGCLFLIPESPVWLVSKEDNQAASKSLRWLRDTDEIVNAELQDLNRTRLMETGQKFNELPLSKRIRATRAWKPFLILTTFFFLQQFSGSQIVVSYAVNFYEEFGTHIDGYVLSLIYITLSLCCSLLFATVVDKLNRKTLSVISAGTVCVTSAAAAAYEFAYGGGRRDKPFFWFPLVCMWTGVAFSFLGLCPLPWVMSGELLPSQVRGFMTSVLWMSVYLYTFLAVKMYPLLVSVINISGVLTLFAISSFLAVIFSILVLPETRGKTLIEIEALW